MVRMPYKTADDLPASMAALSQGPVINIYGVLLHSPHTVEHIARLGASLFSGASLDPVDRELLILAYSLRFQAPYEWAQHVPVSAAVGVSDEQRAALRDGDLGVFAPAQQALLRFASTAADHPTVDDEVYGAVREHYSDEQVIETLVLAGFYYLLGRVSTVIDIDVDPAGEEAVQQALRLAEA